MSAVLSESEHELSAVLSNSESALKVVPFNAEKFLLPFLKVVDLVSSIIEEHIDNALNNLNDVTKRWIRLGFSLLHIATSITQFIIGVTTKSIKDWVTALGKISASVVKFSAAASDLIDGTDNALPVYRWAKYIHKGFNLAEIAIEVIKKTYTPSSSLTSPLSPSFLSPPPSIEEDDSIGSEAKKKRSLSSKNGGESE